ncbi:MAG: hypothetical protein QM715_15740 [Nibricoccus sp.]
MSESPRSRRNIVIILLLLLLALLALILFRCSCSSPKKLPTQPLATEAVPTASTGAPQPTEIQKPKDEILTPATIVVPAVVKAGAAFTVQWTGPNNPEDYLTIVVKEAPEQAYANYQQTRLGSPLELTAPMQAGGYEVRYVAARSKKILGRASIEVKPVEATLTAPEEAVAGTVISVGWTGPNNAGDYVTVVPKGTPDGQYGNYTETAKGALLNLTLPPTAGEAELRYMSAQGRLVLGRRAIKIVAAAVSLVAADEAIAGSLLTINWTGPKNAGDYITIVAKTKPDGQYGNYTEVSKGSPLTVLVPIEPGEAELRYMTGQGAKVLARRGLQVIAAKVSLDAPSEIVAGAPVSVAWSGPNHGGDYITIVAKSARDGQYAAYANTTAGSPLKISAPKETGEVEVRYMSGQGSKVLARRTITIVPKTE